jgi:hypothetical protein
MDADVRVDMGFDTDMDKDIDIDTNMGMTQTWSRTPCMDVDIRLKTTNRYGACTVR